MQSLLKDKAGDKKNRGPGVHIAVTAGPAPHHSATGGIASQEHSTTLPNHDVSGKRSSANRFVRKLNSMSAGKGLTVIV